jgi:hypothetical protein
VQGERGGGADRRHRRQVLQSVQPKLRQTAAPISQPYSPVRALYVPCTCPRRVQIAELCAVPRHQWDVSLCPSAAICSHGPWNLESWLSRLIKVDSGSWSPQFHHGTPWHGTARYGRQRVFEAGNTGQSLKVVAVDSNTDSAVTPCGSCKSRRFGGT